MWVDSLSPHTHGAWDSELKRPILYLSDFLERNRSLYYDNLPRVRERDDLVRWFKFFLVGVIETARSGIETLDASLRLQRDVDVQVQPPGRRVENARKVIRALYAHPLIDAEGVAKATGLSLPSAYKLIGDMEELGTLEEITGAKRCRIYRFERYVRIFRSSRSTLASPPVAPQRRQRALWPNRELVLDG